MRFDYYACTVQADPNRVLETLQKLGNSFDQCDSLAAAYHYDHGLTINHKDTGLACRMLIKEGQEHPFIFASSDATDAFVDLVRNEWPDRHEVTRCDPCQDFYDASARPQLYRLMRRHAKERRMAFRQIKPLDPSCGQTTYLGSRKSEFNLRMYDKGWEVFNKQHATIGRKALLKTSDFTFKVGGADVRPADWIRVELEARPKEKEARRIAAAATPEDVWGLTTWTREFAIEAFKLELEQAYFRVPRVGNDERALRWMCHQYANMLHRMHGDLGDWACVGKQIGDVLQNIQDEATGE